MPYPINQRAHQFNSIQSVPVSFGLWDTALKFLSPGPRSDVTDHLDPTLARFQSNKIHHRFQAPAIISVKVGTHLACVTSVSVRFRNKERGKRVKHSAIKGGSKRAGRGWGSKEVSFLPLPSFIFWLSFHFSRGQNRKSRSSVSLCSETKQKRLLRRLERTGQKVAVTCRGGTLL